jgi:lipopolysaccharide export system permease protein
MPIIWRTLIISYLKVLSFCVIAFISILLTTRLEEIARFAAMKAPLYHLCLFVLYQIPYILPVAIPISSLISSVVLTQNLSSTHELTALRASGFSICSIAAPILIAAAFVSCLNFFIISEIASRSHLTSKQLEHELKSINPLFLLQQSSSLKFRGIYLNAQGGVSEKKDEASDIILAIPNQQNHRITLFLAKKLHVDSTLLAGSKITLLSTKEAKTPERPDSIVIENIGKFSLPISDFFSIFNKNMWRLHDDHLSTSLLITQIQEQRKALEEAKKNNKSLEEIKKAQEAINQSLSEFFRRLSLGLTPLTFTLMGFAFTISITRNRSKKGLFFIISLTSLYLFSFFTAKELGGKLFTLAILLYTFPHLVITASSIITLRRLSKGITA